MPKGDRSKHPPVEPGDARASHPSRQNPEVQQAEQAKERSHGSQVRSSAGDWVEVSRRARSGSAAGEKPSQRGQAGIK